MPRIKGVDVPPQKRIEASLRYIRGVGLTTAKEILDKAKIDPNTRAKDLTDEQVAKLTATINQMELPVEGELRRIVNQNIRRLQEIRCYRGERHKAGLPARGQRTRSNARTRKGKRKTVGGMKKTLSKK
ncbi:30S ribosomal protein S13 [Patescibacteria group bacterium]|nr:30S ribosomal protein S13 [Patescibacteria group bacterium]